MRVEGVEGDFLSQEDIIELHDTIIDESEYHDDKGFIDETGFLFDSAYNSMFTGFSGYEKYPSIEDKAARLCYAIISSHCFRNANKRTGLMSMLITLRMNGKNNVFDQDELFELINGVGKGTVSLETLTAYIKGEQKTY